MMAPSAQHLCVTVAHAHLAQLIRVVQDPGTSPVKTAIMDQHLPALHLIAVVSAFDLGLEEFIDSKNVEWPGNKKRDLYNRIKILGECFPGLNTERLHRIRELRNKVAHIDQGLEQGFVTWSTLDEAIDHVFDAFLELGYICTKPVFEEKYERDHELFPDELGPSGERISHVHRFRVLLNGEPVLKTEIKCSYFPP